MPAHWVVQERYNCYDGHGATSMGQASAIDLGACKAACVTTPDCEAIIVSRGGDFECFRVRDIKLGRCYHWDGEVYDLHVRPPEPPPPPAPARAPPPPYAPGLATIHELNQR